MAALPDYLDELDNIDAPVRFQVIPLAEIDRRYQLAQDMAHGAAAIAMKFTAQRETLDVQVKGRRDYVTAADKAVEQGFAG